MLAPVQPTLYTSLTPVISSGRLKVFLRHAGFDQARALKLYKWNADLGAAFHLPIQAVEVGLRNRVDQALRTVYGQDWWKDPVFRKDATAKARDDIKTVKNRLYREKKTITTDRIVAGLSFGFWVAMLSPRYNPAIWSGQLRTAFVGLPVGRVRGDVYDAAAGTAWLRNRIDHHEPIIGLNLTARYSGMMELLGWVCPIKLAWIQPQAQVMQVLRQAP
ncbi:hypothetical protein [Brevundimonas variabilis]|uniref:Abi-like protein n=1 Tax=Brevundimonas variabilis TaxID=74312 RepID=A0A7W9FF85_9CAUL|nr:hypothetical protein [Brevundimonas variabilis]MBB5747055.1 hypothetical protein [Brevundimonas variabilis]